MHNSCELLFSVIKITKSQNQKAWRLPIVVVVSFRTNLKSHSAQTWWCIVQKVAKVAFLRPDVVAGFPRYMLNSIIWYCNFVCNESLRHTGVWSSKTFSVAKVKITHHSIAFHTKLRLRNHCTDVYHRSHSWMTPMTSLGIKFQLFGWERDALAFLSSSFGRRTCHFNNVYPPILRWLIALRLEAQC